jgi:hypothetical protein
VNILKAREGLDCSGEALGKGLGGVFDFSRVESSNSADLESGSDLCRQTSLTFGIVSYVRACAQTWGRKKWHGRKLETYVLESTISRNSWLVGTAGISFH